MAFAEPEPIESRGIAPRIINGSAAGATEHEYFAALLNAYNWTDGKTYASPGSATRYSWNPFCGASHIGGGKVLTAAHCVDQYTDASTLHLIIGNYSNNTLAGGNGMQYEYCMDVAAGASIPSNYDCIGYDSNSPKERDGYHYTGYAIYNGTDNPIAVPGRNITVHPLYNPTTLEFDIAIITLPSLSNKPALALPKTDLFQYLAKNTSSKNIQVIGHGDTISDTNQNTFSASATLLDVNLTPRTSAECLNSNIGNNFNQFTMICAGDPGYDSCQGDSGGPLIDPITDTLLGIVSWGPSQCGINSSNAYGVYTNVYNLIDWIETGSLELNVDANTKRLANGEVYRLGTGSVSFFGMFALSGLLLISRKRG